MSTSAPKQKMPRLKTSPLAKSSHGRITDQEERIDIKVTKQKVFTDELPYNLKKRFFLFSPKVISYRLRYVPCWLVVLDYKVVLLTKNNTREGRVELIVDEIKGSSALEPGCKLDLEKDSIKKGIIMDQTVTLEQAIKKAKIDARWKVIMGQYKRPPELELVRTQQFMRPFYETIVEFNGKRQTQWIAADGYDNYSTYQ